MLTHYTKTRWADINDEDDDDLGIWNASPGPSTLGQDECKGTKNELKSWFMAILIPLGFTGKCIDSVQTLLQLTQKKNWHSTEHAPFGSFLGALAAFTPITKEDFHISQSLTGEIQREFFTYYFCKIYHVV